MPPMWVRECSPRRGSNAEGHGSHETGCDVDMHLPLMPPDEGRWDMLGTKGYADPRFDRAAAKSRLEAIHEKMDSRCCFFNDPAFIRGRLCTPEDATYDHHDHVRIKPPLRIGGSVG
jgi:hypothetical protein